MIRVTSAEMKFLRRIPPEGGLGVTNYEIENKEQPETEPMVGRMETRQLKWFGQL